jgi:thioredoxin-related protein
MKILSYFLCCIPILLHAQADTPYNGIKFEQNLSWEQIQAKAQAANKYIFVDCYATWCGPCKMMDRDVYPSLDVGTVLNDQFISVKVQMDSTTKDNEQTKKWYPTAQKILRNYKIHSFPTYLFFSPDGKLVHKGGGYLDAGSFIRLSQLARDPKRLLYYSQYEHYKHKKKEYRTMGKLAIFTRDVIGNQTLSDEIAKDYKENYLDKLDATALYTKESLDFICSFGSLVHSKDKFFALCYHYPELFDSITGVVGAAREIVTKTVSLEEITAKVLKNRKVTTKLPDWNRIEATIAKKYSSLDAKRLVLNYKIRYYRDIYKDWRLWAKYKDEMIKTYPPELPYGLEVYVEINGYGGAWHAFLHCPDTTVLHKALEWMELAIELDGENKYHRAAYIDTKANLLYKLGKREEALKLEEEAIALSADGNNIEILEAYEKMQRGEPTWSTQ